MCWSNCLSRFRGDGDLPNFAVAINAMKSSLPSIALTKNLIPVLRFSTERGRVESGRVFLLELEGAGGVSGESVKICSFASSPDLEAIIAPKNYGYNGHPHIFSGFCSVNLPLYNSL